MTSQILIILTALECFYIFYLETCATNSATTSRVFKLSTEQLNRPDLNTLFKNQGVYNGLLGVGLIYGLIINNHQLIQFLLIYIMIVALYGGLTSQKSIILKQGGLPLITLCCSYWMG